jgi:hypothetical protein
MQVETDGRRIARSESIMDGDGETPWMMIVILAKHLTQMMTQLLLADLETDSNKVPHHLKQRLHSSCPGSHTV